MQASVRQPSYAVQTFGHQRAGFTVLSVERGGAAAAAEKGPCPCGLVIFGPLSANTSSKVSGLFLQLQLLSVVMLYFLNRLYPPLLSSLTLHLSSLTLRWSNCNFSISAQPHRKCIHPNNHMFSNTHT